MQETNLIPFYKFETDQLGISDTSIHLLRSRYNYETIEFSNVTSISICNGRQIKNWKLTLFFGLMLLVVGSNFLYHVFYEYFVGTAIHKFYVEQFIVPILPILAGSYMVYISFRNGMIIKISIEDKTTQLPLEQLAKKKQSDELIDFLQTNPATKHKYKSDFENKQQ